MGQRAARPAFSRKAVHNDVDDSVMLLVKLYETSSSLSPHTCVTLSSSYQNG